MIRLTSLGAINVIIKLLFVATSEINLVNMIHLTEDHFICRHLSVCVCLSFICVSL